MVKNLRHVFTSTSNNFKRETTNVKFEAELEEVPYNERLRTLWRSYQIFYRERFLFLMESLIIRWERLHYDSVSRDMKRKEVSENGDKSKKSKAEIAAPLMRHCEGCGIPCHRPA